MPLDEDSILDAVQNHHTVHRGKERYHVGGDKSSDLKRKSKHLFSNDYIFFFFCVVAKSDFFQVVFSFCRQDEFMKQVQVHFKQLEQFSHLIH